MEHAAAAAVAFVKNKNSHGVRASRALRGDCGHDAICASLHRI